MIPDMIFKSLGHSCKGYKMYKDGQSLEQGYKPDYVLKKDDNYIILESENSSSRKTFVGGLIKAAHYLQEERTGILVFIIVPKKNTKASSISSHLKKYFDWIKDSTNLREIHVIEAGHYLNEEKVVKLLSRDFKKLAHSI